MRVVLTVGENSTGKKLNWEKDVYRPLFTLIP